jgi:hypothetical protein
MFYVKYIVLLLIILILFILVSHYINNTRINEELNIQQSEHPNNEVINIMLSKKSPTIFRYELELWDGIDLLIGQSYEDIIEILKNNKIIEYNIQKIYLKPYELPLTRKWDIKCHKIYDTWNKLDNKPTKEDSYLHLISCISGLATICLISPKHTNYINQHSHTFKNILENYNDNDYKNKKESNEESNKESNEESNKESNEESNKESNKESNEESNKESNKESNEEFDYITIPIRPSNMIYIPYGWFYYLYSGKENEYCVIFDAKCKTYLF